MAGDALKADQPSIADLCRPLSAKVMPRSALFTDSHGTKGVDDALKHQRFATASAFGRRSAKRPAGK